MDAQVVAVLQIVQTTQQMEVAPIAVVIVLLGVKKVALGIVQIRARQDAVVVVILVVVVVALI